MGEQRRKQESAKRKRVRSIRLKLICSFLVPVFCIILLGFVSYESASDAIVKSYKNSTEQTANMVAEYIDFLVTSEQNSCKGYIGSEDMVNYVRELKEQPELDAIRNSFLEEMRNKINQDNNIVNIFFLIDGGRSMTYKVANVPEDAFSVYKETAQGATVTSYETNWFLYGQDPEVDAALNLDTSVYSVRIARRINVLNSVLLIDVDGAKIREVLGSIETGDNGYVSLITLSGSEFYSNSEIVLDNPLIYGTDFYQNAKDSEAMSGNQMVTLQGKSYLFVYSKSKAHGFMITALIPEQEMLAGTTDIKKMSMILTLVSVVIALFLGTFISSQMSGTIKYILRQLHKVSKGDLTIHLTSKSRDEFGLLCDGVNETVEHVKSLIVHVNEVSGKLSEAATYVNEASGTFVETSTDIQHVVSELEVGVNKLDTGSEDCLTQMDSLSGKISNVSSNAQEIGKLTSSAGETISMGIASVQGLTDSANSTAEITQNVIIAIEELEDKSKSIHKIIQDINDIAEQTNLLSLNASIEAARAGDAGRGFAVVAEEIRKLSDQCQESAGKISFIVTEIIDKTGEVVDIARHAESVVSSQTEAVAATTKSFCMIDEQVASLLHALDTITNVVEEMNRSRNETLEAIESISAVSAETAACSSSVHNTAGTQLDAVKDLEDASVELRRRSDCLVEILGTFQV